MIVIRVAVTVKPEEKLNFVNLMQQETTEVKQFAGCERFNLYTDIVDENTFLLYEEWQTLADFEAYKNSDLFKQNGAKLFPMMSGAPDSAYFQAEMLPK